MAADDHVAMATNDAKPLTLDDLRAGPTSPAHALHKRQSARGSGRALCADCQARVRDQLALDPIGRLVAIGDASLLAAASVATREAALALLLADHSLWPPLFHALFADPALRRLATERLRRDLLG